MRKLAILLQFFLLVACTQAQETVFSSAPAVTKNGQNAQVSFTLAAKNDVEIAVLNAKGVVVRHLAAGVLGATNPPPEPLKPGLAQSLSWDGNDDLGQPAQGGPYKFRVRAGTSAKFGRFIGEDPYTFGIPEGVATDEDGNVFVLGRQGTHYQYAMTVRVFDPEGRYLREVLPFPANLPPGSMKDVARWDEAGKRWFARNIPTLRPDFYSGATLALLSVSKKNGIFFGDVGNTYQLTPEGAVLAGTLQSRTLMWDKAFHYWGHIAVGGCTNMGVSADGKYLYLSGVFYNRDQFKETLPPGRIYRMKLDGADTMKPFVDIAVKGDGWNAGGAEDGRSNGPTHGVAADAKGNVYICDRVNNRVAVFDEGGKELGAIPVTNPDLVAIHPQTGAIYVLRRVRTGYHQYDVSLEKFAGYATDSKSEASFKLHPSTERPQMALSVKAGKTIIWVAGTETGLTAIEEASGKFVRKETAFRPRVDAQVDWNRIAVDLAHEELYISDGGNKIWKYNGMTGEGGILRKNNAEFNGVDVAVGYTELLTFRTGTGFSGPLERFTHELEPAAFKMGSNVLSKYIYSRFGCGNCEKGLGVGPRGETYISHMYDWTKYCVSGFDQNGNPMKGSYLSGKAPGKGDYPKGLDSAIIGPIPAAGGGVRVDYAGNIYLGLKVLPEGFVPPAGFENDGGYQAQIGTVLKFTPQGGGILGCQDAESKNPGLPRIALKDKQIAEGAVKAYPGIAPFSGGGGCVCRVPRFDIDRFGRLALPNCLTASVAIVDNAGNLIVEVGRYGNFDSQLVNPNTDAGKKKEPTVATPAIPLTWPSGAGFGMDRVYINDVYARRAVRADFIFAAETLCEIK